MRIYFSYLRISTLIIINNKMISSLTRQQQIYGKFWIGEKGKFKWMDHRYEKEEVMLGFWNNYFTWVFFQSFIVIIDFKQDPMGPSISEQLNPIILEYFQKVSAFPSQNKMIGTVQVSSPTNFSNWASTLLKLSKTQVDSILLPKQFRTVYQAPCSQAMVVECTYGCYYISLAEELVRRVKEQEHFHQAQLWYLLLSLGEAAQLGLRYDFRLGDVKPSNLLLNKQGEVKLLAQPSIPTLIDSYSLQKPTDSLYSPEDLQGRKMSFRQNKNDPILSQSFSIGLTILGLGTLTDASTLYKYDKNQIDLGQLTKLKRYWQEFEFYSQKCKKTVPYSKRLKDIIIGLTNVQPLERLSSIQINRILQVYKGDIMALRPFEIDETMLPRTASTQKQEIHTLRSRRKSTVKPSQLSSVYVPSFNNSNQVSFQGNIFNSSPPFHSGAKRESLNLSASSNKRRLSVTAHFPQKGQNGQKL